MTPQHFPKGQFDLIRDLAALSGPFQPSTLFAKTLGDPEIFIRAVTALAQDCDVGAEDGRWLMRPSNRHYLIGNMARTGRLGQRAQVRRSLAPDDSTTDLLSVLLDVAPLNRAAIRDAVDEGGDEPLLQRIVTALDRAGPTAPSSIYLVPAQSALSTLSRQQRSRAVGSRGFYGRADEREALKRWLSDPSAGTGPGLLVTGPPGIGKSALLDEAVLTNDSSAILVRLDFDRAGLDVTDKQGLTMEAARQIGEQLGVRGVGILKERVETLSMQFLPDAPYSSALTPRGLVISIAQALRPREPILMVLDTLEVLEGRGERQIDSLFDWFADLRDFGLPDIRIIAAGRGPITRTLEQFAPPMELGDLSASDVALMLDEAGVRPGLRPVITKIASGHPLKLRLAIEVAARDPGGRFTSGRSVSTAYLYRAVLSRISDPDLQKLAKPGLIVRRLNAEIVQKVVAPKLGMRRMTRSKAEDLLAELATHHWLMDPDDGSGFLKHRSDVRALLLPLLYEGQPRTCAKLDRAAAAYFDARPEQWAAGEALYHRLQLMRDPLEPAPAVSFRLAAQFSEDMIEELPLAAQDVVRTSRSERSASTRAGAGRAEDSQLVGDLTSVIEKRNWAEGDAILGHLDRRRFDPHSSLGDAVRTLYWRSGRWAKARDLLKARDLRQPDDVDAAESHPQFALARAEMRAEFYPRQIPTFSRTYGFNLRLADVVEASPDRLARQGALSVLLAAARYPWPSQGNRRSEFAVYDAFTARWGDGPESQALKEAMTLATDRSREWVRFRQEGGAIGDGRLLAALTPYSDIALSWVSENSNTRTFLERTGELRDGLLEIGALIAPAQPIEKGRMSNPVSAIAQMGLTAEWAQAGAWLWRNPDLRLIGVAAERWRRTAASDWSYDAPRPHGWRQSSPDETVVHRIRTLGDARDPTSAALQELEVWCRLRLSGVDFNKGEAVRLAQAVCKRLTQDDWDRAEADKDAQVPEVWALVLQRRRVPSAFIPPVAILLAERSPVIWKP